MFDMSWGEIMVIGGVALIVIGPKDLPKALRTLGQMTTKVRRMAGEFRGQFDEAMREAELEEVKREVDGLNRSVAAATSTAFNPIQTIRDELRGAVEARPSAPLTPGEAELFGTNPGPALVTEEVGPVPHIAVVEPLREPDVSPPDLYRPDLTMNPETQPLVPLNIDEPSAPALPPAPPRAAGAAA